MNLNLSGGRDGCTAVGPREEASQGCGKKKKRKTGGKTRARGAFEARAARSSQSVPAQSSAVALSHVTSSTNTMGVTLSLPCPHWKWTVLESRCDKVVPQAANDIIVPQDGGIQWARAGSARAPATGSQCKATHLRGFEAKPVPIPREESLRRSSGHSHFQRAKADSHWLESGSGHVPATGNDPCTRSCYGWRTCPWSPSAPKSKPLHPSSPVFRSDLPRN